LAEREGQDLNLQVGQKHLGQGAQTAVIGLHEILGHTGTEELVREDDNDDEVRQQGKVPSPRQRGPGGEEEQDGKGRHGQGQRLGPER